MIGKFACYQFRGIPLCQVLFLIVLALLAYGVYAEEAPLSVIDDTGVTVSLGKPPARIISLAPHVTEMLFAVGAGEKVVGVVSYSDFPEAAKKITQVGSYNRLDIERIIALSPDLIVAWKSGNPQALIERITQSGIPVYLSEPRKLEDIASDLQKLGLLTGNANQGKKAATEFSASLREFKQQNGDKRKLRVFYEIWDAPLMTLNDQHLIGEVIRLCGGENVFGRESKLVPQVNMEAVIKENPEVIVVTEVTPALDKWRKWTNLIAVKNNNLFQIKNPDVLNRHSPRILQGANELCAYLETARMTLKSKND